ncbi:elongation factor 1-alpha [candidate division MSBL1 archaeon SCGC-AAA261F19]|uniref:Elongation factor 1-alpha n=1 Tax=candidate division MSBL1 archaeon SCGC-AAA261F19 TaxID=1698275 RepID=A0A133V8E5_9EURY|nr:elongation factor 1-alpha [candidate division MSBL1 archaeon SCGC-AAA261F19]
MAKKPHLNLVIIGHVDHGKSTLVGRTFYEKGLISDSVIKKFEEMGDKGKTFKFAWVMDSVSEERERGLTIDLAHKRFETDDFYFTVIDAPGHRDFVKNMITGTSQADAGVLVVAADDGVMPQTREHSALAYTLGVGQLVVVINKMDLVDYEQKAFEDLKSDVVKLLSGIGFKNPEKFPYVPTSAFQGENVTKPSEEMGWYDGPTFLSALDTFEVPEKPVNKPLRIPVQDVYSIKGVGTVPVGRVETGVIKKGDRVLFTPSGNTAEVKSIEMHHEEIPEAEPGDNIGFNVRGLSRDDIRRGEVASHPDNPPKVAEEFTARIAVLAHPTGITAGYTPVFHAHTAQTACEITEILEKLDPKTGKVVEKNPDFIKKGDMATIRVKPTRPLVIETAEEMPELSRFAIRDMGKTIAAGACISLVEKKKS